jgi:hypothetical protein
LLDTNACVEYLNGRSRRVPTVDDACRPQVVETETMGNRETGHMQITLKPDQEVVIQAAIRAGLIQSIDEFIDTAIEALPRCEAGFDKEKARLAGARIREIRRGVRLELQGMSIRELAHAGHKY